MEDGFNNLKSTDNTDAMDHSIGSLASEAGLKDMSLIDLKFKLDRLTGDLGEAHINLGHALRSLSYQREVEVSEAKIRESREKISKINSEIELVKLYIGKSEGGNVDKYFPQAA